MKIVIIDYDMGNVRSISNAIKYIGYEDVEVSKDHVKIKNADCLILPGVGAFRDAIQHLKDRGLIEVLNETVLKKGIPILGICLGMQLLFERSYEGGDFEGLSWIKGNVTRIHCEDNLRVPHIGWNNLQIQNDSDVFAGLREDKNFYFVHSYYADCDEADIIAKFEYGRLFCLYNTICIHL